MRNVPADATYFTKVVEPGETIIEVLERVAPQADAAIVLATPDDVGQLYTGQEKIEPINPNRARENVWMECGWFWGRLGRSRTLLFVKDGVEVPSNMGANFQFRYKNNPAEKGAQLEAFIKGLDTLKPDSVTELLYISSTPVEAPKQWDQIHQAAVTNIVITGIAMRTVVQTALSQILCYMEEKPELRLRFLVVDPKYAKENGKILTKIHGRDAVQANHRFFSDLLDTLNDNENQETLRRIDLGLYPGFPTFSAVAADGGDWGSEMIVQTFLPGAGNHNYPRFKLRRRCRDGAYDNYWRAVKFMQKESHFIQTETLATLVQEIAA